MESLTYRQPRLVVLALLVIVSAGASAFLSLGRQEDPSITNLFAVITTTYPGAEPSRVESLVTRPIEDTMRGISEVKHIDSTSATGVSVVSVELDENTDPALIEGIWSEARDDLVAIESELPAGAGRPDLDSDGIAAFAAIFAVTPAADGADSRLPVSDAVLGRHTDEIAKRLRNLSGTQRVERFGEPIEEVRVRVDPLALATLGLDTERLAARVEAADAKVRAGRTLDSEADLLLDVTGDIETLDRLRRVVVMTDDFGRTLQLGDIARIERSAATPEPARARSDGQRAVLIGVQIDNGLQVDRWMAAVQAEIEDLATALPASLRIEQVFDQARYTRDRLGEVATNMAIGVALVILVLLFTLGPRAALVVASVLPIVSFATLASMNFIGLPLHQMSVTGLIVALGLLVDAAIVMTDEIRQRLSAGLARTRAVGESVRRLAMPLLASTVTTALSFVPMILLPGGAGDFVGAIAIAVVLMLGWSLVIALTITPALAGWLLVRDGRGFSASGLPSGRIGRLFRRALVWGARQPVRSIAVASILPLAGFLSFGTLTAQFFPGVERDQFHIEVELAAGVSLDRTESVVDGIDTLLRETDGVRQVAWTLGESAPAFYYNIVGSRQNEPGFAQALVTTASAERTAELLEPLQVELDRRFPAARVLVRGLVQGPPVDAPVEFRLIGPDVALLRQLGEQIRATLLSLDTIKSVRTSLEGGAPQLRIDIDEASARLAGLDMTDIARQLQAGLDGIDGGSLVEGGERLPVRVRLGDAVRTDLVRIASLPIAVANALGGDAPILPLSAIADVTMVPSDSPIVRRDGERVNKVQAFVPSAVLPEEALQQAQAALDAAGFELPSGYRLEYGGDADARDSTVNNLLAPLGLIVTLSIATVVLTFGSFRLSAITFVVAGLSAGLSLLALAVFDYPFGIQAIIGVIGSIGVSINAAIIILTGLQAEPRARAGEPEAIADVVMGSSRHILSTTLTTFGGFLPLILGGGGFWPPFAMSIAGGVLLSSVVSFWFTPACFRLLYRDRSGVGGAADEDHGHIPRRLAGAYQ